MKNKPTRLTQLDGLRGYAAIAVVVTHSLLDRDPTQNQRILRPVFQDLHGPYDVVTKLVFMLFNAEAAVVLFFVLSGTVLCESLRQRRAGALATAAGFSVRRCLRLYPTFFVALASCLAAFALAGMFELQARRFWSNAMLSDFSILGASWSLQVEFLAIPFILVSFWGLRKVGPVGIFAAYALFATVLSLSLGHSYLVNYQRFLSCFAIGALVTTTMGASIANLLPAAIFPLVVAAVVTVRHFMGLHWWSMDVMQVLAGLLVAQLYYGRAGCFGRFLDRSLSQYLGRLSYSIYLFSVVYLILFAYWTRGFSEPGQHPLEWGFPLSLLIVSATIGTAHFTEIALERPSIAFGRWLTRFSAPAPDAFPEHKAV